MIYNPTPFSFYGIIAKYSLFCDDIGGNIIMVGA